MATKNQYIPTERSYWSATILKMVKSGFTLFVEGKSFVKIEATVEVIPPNKNNDENKNPKPSFVKVLILINQKVLQKL